MTRSVQDRITCLAMAYLTTPHWHSPPPACVTLQDDCAAPVHEQHQGPRKSHPGPRQETPLHHLQERFACYNTEAARSDRTAFIHFFTVPYYHVHIDADNDHFVTRLSAVYSMPSAPIFLAGQGFAAFSHYPVCEQSSEIVTGDPFPAILSAFAAWHRRTPSIQLFTLSY